MRYQSPLFSASKPSRTSDLCGVRRPPETAITELVRTGAVVGVFVGVGDGVCIGAVPVRPDRITASDSKITIITTKTKIRIVFRASFTLFLFV